MCAGITYRNFLLAEGARFAGLCDKIGRGIHIVFESALSGGLDFPTFESGDNKFTARLLLGRSEEFREFVKRRSSSLPNIDQIVALRLLWSRNEAAITEVATILQRDTKATARVLADMERKLMIESTDTERQVFRLSSAIRYDISNIFREGQLDLAWISHRVCPGNRSGVLNQEFTVAKPKNDIHVCNVYYAER